MTQPIPGDNFEHPDFEPRLLTAYQSPVQTWNSATDSFSLVQIGLAGTVEVKDVDVLHEGRQSPFRRAEELLVRSTGLTKPAEGGLGEQRPVIAMISDGEALYYEYFIRDGAADVRLHRLREAAQGYERAGKTAYGRRLPVTFQAGSRVLFGYTRTFSAGERDYTQASSEEKPAAVALYEQLAAAAATPTRRRLGRFGLSAL